MNKSHLLSLIIFLSPASYAADDTLFSCNMLKKSVSIKGDRSSVIYKFSTDGKLELSYPDTPGKPQDQFSFKQENDISNLSFTLGTYEYITYYTNSESGVLVKRNGVEKKRYICDKLTPFNPVTTDIFKP